MRLIDIEADRAKWRNTLSYQLTSRLQVGLEYNPVGNDIGPLANWRILDESHTRPALILGTSSDRIGTSTGRSVYATLSKNLEEEIGLPVAPYAGAAYGTRHNTFRGIGGMGIYWSDRVSSMHLYDGFDVHHILSYQWNERINTGLLLVDGHHWGVSFGIQF